METNQLGTLEQKDLKDQELIEIHRGLFNRLLTENNVSLKNKKIALNFYDVKVTIQNIRLFYNRHINIFAQALLQDNLESIYKHSTHSK